MVYQKNLVNTSLSKDNIEKLSKIIIKILLYSIFFLLPAIRVIGIDRDSSTYAQNAQVFLDSNFKTFFSVSREPTFFLIVFISNIFFNDPIRGMLIIYAFLGVFIKLYAIEKYSTNVFLSIIIYISFFYILQEFNTIRTGVATAIFLLSFQDIKNRNYKKYLLKIALATLFHYSAIILVIFYFVNIPFIAKNLNILLLSAIVIDVLKINIIILKTVAQIMPPFLGFRMLNYINMLQNGQFTNVSSQRYLFNILFVLIILLIENTKLKKSKDLVFLNDLFKISVAFFFATKCVPVIASRVSETSSILLVLLVPEIVNRVKLIEKPIASLLIFLFCIPIFIMYINSYYPFYLY